MLRLMCLQSREAEKAFIFVVKSNAKDRIKRRERRTFLTDRVAEESAYGGAGKTRKSLALSKED